MSEDNALKTLRANPETAALLPPAEQFTEYVHAATAERSRQAYREDLQRFLNWGGKIPATPEEIATYLASHGETHAPATLTRWTASLSKAHTTQGLANPCRTELVRTLLRGIRRRHGAAQRQVAPILREDIVRLVSGLGENPKDRRDRALLLLGFAGAFRRSELVALTMADLNFSAAGVAIRIRRSKTDPAGYGRTVGIPYAQGPICPVRALQAWLTQPIDGTCDNPTDKPVFRGVNRHGQVSTQALSAHAVALIIKKRCRAVGLDPSQYSGHSLRAGFCTAAALAGVPPWKIRKQTGHKTSAMLERYIRDGRLFADNPMEGLI